MITVTIAGVDRTSLIEDITIYDNINNRSDTTEFSLLKTIVDTYVPVLKSTVVVVRNGVTIFNGGITRTSDQLVGENTIRYSVSCIDVSFDLNRHLPVERYTSQTVNYIIADLVTKYAPGFTVANVNCGILINSIAFNRITVSDCIKKLADMVNYSWYVDYAQDVHFFASNAEPAPFNAVSGNYIRESMSIQKDITQIRNRIIVQGGEASSPTRTVSHAGNGTTTTFPTQWKFATLPTVTVGGFTKTVGLDFKDNDLSFQCMWDFNQKVIRFTAGNIPPAPGTGTNITISGEPLLPIVVNVPDSASILTYGEYEFAITDKNIKSEDQAIERGLAELKAYSNSISEGKFDTYQAGLRSGQVIRIADPLRGLDEDFLIQKVQFKFLSANATYDGVWSVTVATLKTVGIISVLQKLLLNENLTSDEQIQLYAFISLKDSFGIRDNFQGDYRVKITVDKTKVPANQTAFPVYVDLSHLPAHFFTYVQSDGRDIRVFASDGITQLPYELVAIDTVAKTGEVFFKGDLSSTVNTDFYIYYGNASAVAYARTDTYGSNNVWTGAHGIYHATVNAKDSSVNARDGVFYEASQGAGFWNFPGHVSVAESAATLAGTTAMAFGKVTTFQKVAQSFVMSSTPSKQIDIMIQKLANTGAPTAGVTFALHSDSAGIPGTLLSSGTVTWNGTGALGVGVDFIASTQTGALTAGNTYWLVLTHLTPSDTNYINIAYDPSGSYGVFKYFDGTVWNTQAGCLRFRIMKSGGVNFVGSALAMSTQNMQMTLRLKKSNTSYEALLSNGVSGTSHLEINGGGSPDMRWRPNGTSGSGAQASATGTNADGTWRNFCWRLNASNQQLFVNGVPTDTAKTANTLATDQNLSWIGLIQSRLNATYGQALTGQLKFLRLRPAQTDQFNATESNNLDSPATFYSIGTPETISDTITRVTTTSRPYFVGTTAVMGFSTIG